MKTTNKDILKLILEEGEGYKIEFKGKLSGLDKEIVAFANSSGGKIYIGISDDLKIKGIKITNNLKSQIQDIANNCQPVVKIIFEEYNDILILDVREGDDKPYKCSSGFYKRIGPNSQKINRNEIIDFYKSEGKIRFDELENMKFNYNKHFDNKKLNRYLQLAGITRVLDSKTILLNLGVAEKQEGKIFFNNTGVLFFSKNLNDLFIHTTITCALYKGIKKVHVLDRKDFNEDILSNIDNTMIFLQQHIPVKYEMTGTPRRKEVPEIPLDALREAVINAVAHRDYFEKGSNIMVEMFDDRIEISDFGGLPKGIKPKEFGTKSVLRNPNIADLLNRVKYVEKMGTGINKIKDLLKRAGLPEPVFKFTTFFTIVFKRPTKIKKDLNKQRLVEGLVEGLVENQKKMLILIKKNPKISKRELSIKIGISTTAIDKNITTLKKKKFIKRVGPDKGGYWEIIK